MPTQRDDNESDQLQLLASADGAVLADDERKGNFTGERLKACRPQVYKEILQAYAGGASMRALSRLYHVSVNTVSAVVRSQASVIETLKKEIGARATSVHSLAWERLEEKLSDQAQVDKTSLKDMAVVVGITGDRAALADGLPTQIHEHRRVEADDINGRFLDAIEIEADEVPGMGFRGELLGQKAAPVDGAGAAAGGAQVPGDGASVPGSDAANKDSKSLVDGLEGAESMGKQLDDA